MNVSGDARCAPGARERTATRLAFFIAGLGMAAWAPLVPYAKQRAMLDDGSLGLLLLCLGVGSIVAMPLSGLMVSRFGCRKVLYAATAAMCCALPLLATVPVFAGLALSLFLFGAGIGMIDCTINIQAVVVERAAEKPLMSGFHGLFSVGGIVGAAGVSTLLGTGWSPWMAVMPVIAVSGICLLWAAPGLLPVMDGGNGPAFAIPRGRVLLIGLACFVVFLTEGAVLDWSAVFLTTVRRVEEARGGLGYAAFAATMTLGRLTGDMVVKRLGDRAIVAGGGLCAAAGMALATLAPAWWCSLAGFALIGLGCSNMVPVLYSCAGRQKAMPESVAIPAITTLGYSGILAGPAVLGLFAAFFGLGTALLGISVLLMMVSLSSGRVVGRREEK